jgi:hypothetical protein
MPKTTTVELSEPIITHGGALRSVTFREPTAAEYWRIGEIRRYGNASGVIYAVENEGALKSYIETCLVDPKDPLALDQIKSLKDGMKIKEAISNFFMSAELGSISTTSSDSSSSIPNSA